MNSVSNNLQGIVSCDAPESMLGKRVADSTDSCFPSVKVCRISPSRGEPVEQNSAVSSVPVTFSKITSVQENENVSNEYGNILYLDQNIPSIDRKEMSTDRERIKKRRSSMRRCSVVAPLLSETANIQDCVKIMSQNLPYPSRLSLLLEMGIRNVLNQMEISCTDDDFEPFKTKLLLGLQGISSKVANDFVGNKINAAKECYSKSKDIDSKFRSSKRLVYQAKEEELLTENNCWKSLMKIRKLNLQQAQRELKESVNGATYLEEELVLSTLTEEHKNILSAKPDYNIYLDKVKLAQQKVLHTQDELKKTKILLESLTNVSRSTSDACCSVIKKNTLRDITNEGLKDILTHWQEA